VLLIADGDGTIRAVVQALHGAHIPIALLPVDTGSLLARNLGIALTDVQSVVDAAFTAPERRIDLGVADLEDEDGVRTSHVFLAMAGIGLDAAMAENTTRASKRRLGWLAYVTPIARSIIANRRFQVDYRIDHGKLKSTRAHTIIVGNCGPLSGNMLLIPADDRLAPYRSSLQPGVRTWTWGEGNAVSSGSRGATCQSDVTRSCSRTACS